MPFPNEHACRLESPDGFDKIRRENCAEKSNGKCIDVLYGIDDDGSTRQALRYKTKTWNESDARGHCRNEGGTFEPAAGEESMMNRKNWYSVRMQGSIAEISIFDEIGFWGTNAQDFQREFNEIRDAASIKVSINSPGGSFFDGMAIYQLLSTVRDRVDVEVYGIAASIASVIALAGKSVSIARGSYYMIHNPYTIAVGSADEMRKTADVLDKMRGDLANIYAGKTGLDADEVLSLMDEETWYTADEALEAGFADEVPDYGEVAARMPNLNQFTFAKTPESLLEQKRTRDGIETARQFERFLRDAGYSQREAKAITSNGFGATQRDVEQTEEQRDVAPAASVIPFSVLAQEAELELSAMGGDYAEET